MTADDEAPTHAAENDPGATPPIDRTVSPPSSVDQLTRSDHRARRRQAYDRLNAGNDAPPFYARYFHAEVERFVQQQVPPGSSVLHVGCGSGRLLAGLRPRRGVGIDFSHAALMRARERYPELSFIEADAEELPLEAAFDYVVLSDVLGDLVDVWRALRGLTGTLRRGSRIVIVYYNFLWEPILKLAELLGLKRPQLYQNWLALADIANLIDLNGLEVVAEGYRLLLPIRVPLLSSLCNRVLAKLPFVRKLCLLSYAIARPVPKVVPERILTCSVIIPTRNEAGNVAAAVERTPAMGAHTEIIFVDGDSTDGTVERIEQEMTRYAGTKDIKLIHQVPRGSEGHRGPKMLRLGKGDAVRKGFAAARGDVLMILDGDLTVAPEDLPMFLTVLAEGRAEVVNGSRLVYPLEKESMRFLNMVANKAFGLVFTWALGQRVKDTLCGTKALRRSDYGKILAAREHFGDFDPFGDFDLLFAAAKSNLRIVDLPIRYHARTYGEVKIQRWRHGLLLARMSWIAVRKLKLS